MGTSKTVVPYSRELLGCLAEFAETRAKSTALVLGDERVTYAGLAAMAMSAYHAIDTLPAPEGSRVALRAAKSPRTVALIVACLLARRPFLVPSIELGEDALETMLARAGATHVLTAEVDGSIAGREEHKIDVTAGPFDLGGLRDPDLTADSVSFIFTTSGSPGPILRRLISSPALPVR
ncbi:AMP-binding protein [Amycolatopsis sp. NPDC004772]